MAEKIIEIKADIELHVRTKAVALNEPPRYYAIIKSFDTRQHNGSFTMKQNPENLNQLILSTNMAVVLSVFLAGTTTPVVINNIEFDANVSQGDIVPWIMVDVPIDLYNKLTTTIDTYTIRFIKRADDDESKQIITKFINANNKYIVNYTKKVEGANKLIKYLNGIITDDDE